MEGDSGLGTSSQRCLLQLPGVQLFVFVLDASGDISATIGVGHRWYLFPVVESCSRCLENAGLCVPTWRFVAFTHSVAEYEAMDGLFKQLQVGVRTLL